MKRTTALVNGSDLNDSLSVYDEVSRKNTMTLLFYHSHCWKTIKIELRQVNVILIIASTELHNVRSIVREKTRETLEIA